jgi:hypothetical protein
MLRLQFGSASRQPLPLLARSSSRTNGPSSGSLSREAIAGATGPTPGWCLRTPLSRPAMLAARRGASPRFVAAINAAVAPGRSRQRWVRFVRGGYGGGGEPQDAGRDEG